MKYLVLTLTVMFASVATADERVTGWRGQHPWNHFWVFGDSLTAVPDSWARQIERNGLAIMNITAQPGARAIDTDMPRHLSCANSEVIYWLGTNDAGNEVPTMVFRQTIIDHMQFFKGRSCTVWLMPPIIVDLSPRLLERTTKMNTIVKNIARNYKNVTVIEPPYDGSDTTDGLHPTVSQQTWIADFVATEIGLQ